MEYYVLNDYKDKTPRKLNHKKVIKDTIILCIVIAIMVLISMYIGCSEFRGWIDKYVFRKEITENTGPIIDVDSESNSYIYAYDSHVVILSKNNLNNYSSNGNKEFNVEVTITNPLFASNGRYLVIAEKGGNKLYLISGEHIIWQKDLEGDISQISVNQNGYVTVSHKNIVKLFNKEGRELVTAYLSSTYAVDTAVSDDNSMLAIAEINYSGSLIQSSVKIISVDKAQTDAENAIIYTYKADKKNIITNLRYQSGNRLVIMLDNKIVLINGEEYSEEILFDENTLFADINLIGNAVQIKKVGTGLFSANSETQIKRIAGNQFSIYNAELLPKSISTYENIIAINFGTEVHFVDTNGWVIKKYTSTRNIKDVVISRKHCGNCI